MLEVDAAAHSFEIFMIDGIEVLKAYTKVALKLNAP
jgi:hypothetical protein